MFLVSSQHFSSAELHSMKSIEGPYQGQYQGNSSSRRSYEEPRLDELGGYGYPQVPPPRYNSISETSVGYSDGYSIGEEDSEPAMYVSDNTVTLPNERPEDYCPRDNTTAVSPLQSHQQYSFEPVSHRDSGRRLESVYLNQNSNFAGTVALTSERELFVSRPPSTYGTHLRQDPQEQYSPLHGLQVVPFQNTQTYTGVYETVVAAGAPAFQQIAQQPHSYEYPDLTTMVNSCQGVVGPLVEATFVDSKVCRICNKRITRDMSRHYRTHQKDKRFVCVFPKQSCGYKNSQFNRRYDFKKHLLNKHFVYDDPEVVKIQTLRDKVVHWGTCPCGQRFLAQNWLDTHILSKDETQRCPLLEETLVE